MAKSGPIVFVEDNIDDQEIFNDVMKELEVTNERLFFSRCEDAFEYLKTTTDQPLMIFSDVNIPVVSGLEFKMNIDKDPELRQKSIPFVFLSTSVDQHSVTEAYTKMTVQGFFQKKNSIQELKKDLKMIIDYWKVCRHPHSG